MTHFKKHLLPLALAALFAAWHCPAGAAHAQQAPGQAADATEVPPSDVPSLRQHITPPADDATQPPPRNGGGNNPQLLPPQTRPLPRDPTVVSPDLRLLLDPQQENASPGELTMQIRGRVSIPGGATMAVLDVNGGYFLVEEGSQIDVPAGSGSVTLIVERLTSTDLDVQVEQLNRVYRLR